MKMLRINREICSEIDKIHCGKSESIIITCPHCDGTGADGYDRCVPQNPYICEVCSGYGRVQLKPLRNEPNLEIPIKRSV